MNINFSKLGILCLFFILICLLGTISGTNLLKSKNNRISTDIPLITTSDYTVQRKIDRGVLCFYTQGIFFDHDNNLVESGGLYGQSVLIRMKYPELKVISKINLHKKYFGEGTAKCGDFIYQLTWREGTILKYKYNSLENVQGESIKLDPIISQGWGLTESGDGNLYESNGSDKIFKLDCNTLKTISQIQVTFEGEALRNINAMTFAGGFIWANKYYDSRIFKIDPLTGNVVKAYDMSLLVEWELNNSKLTQDRLQSGDVLNGIAYNNADPKNPYFLLTGKKWDHYFIVNFK